MNENLQREETEARRRLVAALRYSESPSRRDDLMLALGDVDWRVRKEAVRVASEVAVEWELISPLVGVIPQSENVGLRNAALEVLERLGPQSADALLVALPHAKEASKKFFAEALGFAGPVAVAKLSELSRNPNPNVAQAALEALAKVGGPNAEATLKERLSSPDPVQRLASLEGLERLQVEIEFAHVKELMGDPLVRRVLFRVLAFASDPEAAEALAEVLEEDDVAAVEEATLALGRLLNDRDLSPVVVRCVKALSPEGHEALHRAIASSRPGLRAPAATLLLWSGDASVIPVVASLAAKDLLSTSMVDALRALGTAAVPALLDNRPDDDAARASSLELASDLLRLEDAPDEALVETLHVALIEALESEDELLEEVAAEILIHWVRPGDGQLLFESATRFPGQAAVPVGLALESLARSAPDEVRALLEHVDWEGALGSVMVPPLMVIGGDFANERICASLSATEVRTRQAALRALPVLQPDRALELASLALTDESVDVQLVAVRVLAAIRDAHGEPVGVSRLRSTLSTSAEVVIAAAAHALGKVQHPVAVEALREMAEVGSLGTKMAAVEGLRRLEDPRLFEILEDFLADHNPEVAKEGLSGLSLMEDVDTLRLATLGFEHPSASIRAETVRLVGRAALPGIVEILNAQVEAEIDPSVKSLIYGALASRSG